MQWKKSYGMVKCKLSGSENQHPIKSAVTIGGFFLIAKHESTYQCLCTYY